MKEIITIFLFISPFGLFGQTIDFNDSGLKDYLINKNCVDTLNNFNAPWSTPIIKHINVDLNNDNEIQISEALSVEKLNINDFGDHFSILSVQDLSHFENLKWLQLTSMNLVYDISNLGLDNLKRIYIGSSQSLKIIDLSDLPNLTESLRIEDQYTIDYLNIQNGNRAEFFSLFYSDNIAYACVDSIYNEYNLVASKMISGAPEIDECEGSLTSNDIINQYESIRVFPNPTNGIIRVESKKSIEELLIFNSLGEMLFQAGNISNPIDVSHLTSGIYFLSARIDGEFRSRKIIMN